MEPKLTSRIALFAIAILALPLLTVPMPAAADQFLPFGGECSQTPDNTRTCTAKYYLGEPGPINPCRLPGGPGVGGVCIDLQPDYLRMGSGTLTVTDVTGKQVAGHFEFARIDPYYGWVTYQNGTFCDGIASISQSYSSQPPRFLEVDLGMAAGSVPWQCNAFEGRNFTGGTIGTVTVTFPVFYTP